MWIDKIENKYWRDTIREEYLFFKDKIRSLPESKNYYVYALCNDHSMPFYIGKGKNLRAYDHIKKYANKKVDLKTHYISQLSEPPTVTVVHSHLTEDEAIEHEQYYIEKFLRLSDGGILLNIMPHGFYINDVDILREKGRYAGRLSVLSGRGIHDPNYDRSATSKSNWANGLLDHLDRSAAGKLGSKVIMEKQLGIHDPKNKHKRVEWAKQGAAALELSGNRGGVCSKKWIEENKERQLLFASQAGKVGGKVVGSMPWWTNGKVNKRSVNAPGDDFYRGMTKGNKNV